LEDPPGVADGVTELGADCDSVEELDPVLLDPDEEADDEEVDDPPLG
jgi:hypothetical protein